LTLRDGSARLTFVAIRFLHVQEPRHHFREELDALERRTVRALGLVVEQLDTALESLTARDVALAQRVVTDDALIDALYLDVHQRTLSVLARQTPVAGDLRLVIALLHIIRCVERMGDQCANVAKLVPLLGSGQPKDQSIRSVIESMAQLARSQTLQTQAALKTRHLSMARHLVRQHAAMGRLNGEILTRAVEIGNDAEAREWAMFMVLAARCLERIGDNAVGIAEQTVFVVTGSLRAAHVRAQPA
jgi:phosphate transport system protein